MPHHTHAQPLEPGGEVVDSFTSEKRNEGLVVGIEVKKHTNRVILKFLTSPDER